MLRSQEGTPFARVQERCRDEGEDDTGSGQRWRESDCTPFLRELEHASPDPRMASGVACVCLALRHCMRLGGLSVSSKSQRAIVERNRSVWHMAPAAGEGPGEGIGSSGAASAGSTPAEGEDRARREDKL